jgi:hypothetical protein
MNLPHECRAMSLGSCALAAALACVSRRDELFSQPLLLELDADNDLEDKS